MAISDFELADTGLHIDVMKQELRFLEEELRFLEDLTRATSYEMANDTLTLLGGRRIRIACLETQPGG